MPRVLGVLPERARVCTRRTDGGPPSGDACRCELLLKSGRDAVVTIILTWRFRAENQRNEDGRARAFEHAHAHAQHIHARAPPRIHQTRASHGAGTRTQVLSRDDRPPPPLWWGTCCSWPSPHPKISSPPPSSPCGELFTCYYCLFIIIIVVVIIVITCCTLSYHRKQ